MALITPFLASSITLLLLLLSQVSRCWVFPKGYHENAVYQFTYLANGDWWTISPNVTQYKIDPNIPVVPVKCKSKWPAMSTRDCFHKKDKLDAGDLQSAENALMRWCEHFDPMARSIVVSLFNNVTVYTSYWHFGPGWLDYEAMGYCSARDIQYASAMMDKCGPQSASVVHMTFLERSYGRSRKGAKILA